MVQVGNQLLYCSSPAVQYAVAADPARYLAMALPTVLPALLPASQRGVRAAHCQRASACPVCAVADPNARRVPGVPQRTLLFDAKLYRPCGVRCLRLFQKMPWKSSVGPPQARLPTAAEAKDVMVALQRSLCSSQMPASVADALPCALASLSFRRVVFPGLSVTQSQLLHLALTLRLAHARSPARAHAGARA
jgi:hypothetical protein